ncbi:MAG: chemotaxis protein CheW [Deltaproteobacteria bacterium]|nr:chemotaxis protein CheW [Deltaproteobacteria bacterium]
MRATDLAHSPDGVGHKAGDPAITRVCTFTLGDSLFGIDAGRVLEIVAVKDLSRVPGSPRHVRGLMNLRGQVVTCLDLDEILERPPSTRRRGFAVVLDDGEGLTSLEVDRVSDVFDLDPAEVEPVPATLTGAAARHLVGAYKLPGQLLLLLDVRRLLDDGAAT